MACYGAVAVLDQVRRGGDPDAMNLRTPLRMRLKRALRAAADDDLMPLVDEKKIEAFEVFYERHAGAAYSLAHRIVGDSKLAEDVTQEAFLSIWRSTSGYDAERGSVRSWTLGVVRNRAIDAIRRETSRRTPPLDLRGDEALEHERSDAQTDTQAIERDTAQRLRGAVGQLPAEQARVIELAYYGGFSQNEIARMLDLPLGTVKGRVRLGLEKIRTAHAEGLS
jgi:RNA polymerase sigma-70 factor, ECF subfamily